MREVLLTDVALWGALITMAALIIIRRWRSSHSWIPARRPRREAPELAGQKMSPPKTAGVTGLGEDTRAPDRAAPRPARPAPAAPPQAAEKANPKARPHRPAAQRDDRQTPSRAATPSEQIVSYYDQADQPIAAYLAALGWTQQLPHPPSGQQAQIPRSAAGPREGTASLASRHRVASNLLTMDKPDEVNAAIWQAEEMVQSWAAEARPRERTDGTRRRLLAAILPFTERDAFTFLDLGAGTGAASRPILDVYPRSTAILADFSAAMRGVGEQEMEPYAGRYRYVEYDMSASDWPTTIPADLDAVVTSLCVHHLPDERKAGLFTEIFSHLAPGGWYLNYDPVRAEDPVVTATWERVNDARDPEAAAKRLHRSPEEQARWDNHVRFISPLPQQLEYLRLAGFQGIDVYWKQLDYVLYGGRRPS
jgi:SAM-dependent methyltransferase